MTARSHAAQPPARWAAKRLASSPSSAPRTCPATSSSNSSCAGLMSATPPSRAAAPCRAACGSSRCRAADRGARRSRFASSLQVRERDHLPLLGGELAQEPFRHLPVLHRIPPRLGRGGGGFAEWGDEHLLPPTNGAHPVDSPAPRTHRHPRLGRAPPRVVLPCRAPELPEDLLQHLGGLVHVPQHAAKETERAPGVEVIERRER